MRVHIETGTAGARAAAARGDVLVLVDALRASVTIASALFAGASRVIPVLSVEEAVALCQGHDDIILAGERGGAQISDFDLGNSPTQIVAHRDELRGRTVVLTTSNGTRCVHAALQGGAAAILAGALPNATVTARAAWQTAHRLRRDITLLAAGLDDEPAAEDGFAARWLLQLLSEEFGVSHPFSHLEPPQPSNSTDIFLRSEAGRRLSELGYAADVSFCAQFDTVPIGAIYENGLGFVPVEPDPTQPHRPGIDEGTNRHE